MKHKDPYVAFTLVEVLITLGIIGIVAALTMPTLLANINKRVTTIKIRTIKYKFTQATDKMKSLGLIGPYDSTADFVNELKKHLAIAKICDVEHLRGCWPYDYVTLTDGTQYDIAKTKTGKFLKMKNDEYSDFSSPNVGIITADGTPMIIAYNTKCKALNPEVSYPWVTEDNIPVTNETASCVAAVFEINGRRNPNKLNQDVILFNANGLGSDCALKLPNGKCFSAPILAPSIPDSDCHQYAKNGEFGITSCSMGGCAMGDFWAGAAKHCGGADKLPSMEDLAQMAMLFYGTDKTIGPEDYFSNSDKKTTFDTSKFGFSLYGTAIANKVSDDNWTHPDGVAYAGYYYGRAFLNSGYYDYTSIQKVNRCNAGYVFCSID